MIYRHFSGQNLGRLAAPSDGIFAVAMTLLVLTIRVPEPLGSNTQHALWSGGAWSAEGELLRSLAPIGPQLLTYSMSFLTLGIFWAGQQTQLNQMARSDHRLTWIHLAFHVIAASRRRIVVHQLLYAAAASMCVVNTYLAIGLLFALQLNSVLVPSIGRLNRF